MLLLLKVFTNINKKITFRCPQNETCIDCISKETYLKKFAFLNIPTMKSASRLLNYVKDFNYMRFYLTWGAVIGWMILIFYLSHQPGTASSDLSSNITEQIIYFLTIISPLDLTFQDFQGFIRKGAHFFAYFVLGILTYHALLRSNLQNKREKFREKWRNSSRQKGAQFFNICIALLISVVYAISDEWHQTFIPGRSGEIRDVLIDTFGAFTGISLYVFSKSVFTHWNSDKF